VSNGKVPSLQARGMWSADQADDKERFLADLRALRDTSALGYDELAARAHYPSDVLKEAENGPSLPGLPILAAYVRACEGDVPEWEERWRRLGFEARADPGLPVRPAWASPAAVAGARAGIGVATPDAYDPERIRAALRSSHVRADQGAPAGAGTGAAAGRGDVVRRGAEAGSAAGWDASTGRGEGTGNGSHPAWPRSEASPGAAVSEAPTDAATAGALRRDPFSTSWLEDSQPIPPVPDSGVGRQGRGGADHDQPQQDAGQAPQAWTDFWTPVKAAAAPADVQRPAAPTDARPRPAAPRPSDVQPRPAAPPPDVQPRPAAPPPDVQPRPAAPPPAHEPTAAATSWSAFTPSLPKVGADPARGAAADQPKLAGPGLAQAGTPAVPADASSAVPARSEPPAESAASRPPAAPRTESRDRYYPLRLLAVIVVAALIGSVLVLLLR
jgi:hypothetical protein